MDKTIDEQIEVMTAYKNGKTIEHNIGCGWHEITKPCWCWDGYFDTQVLQDCMDDYECSTPLQLLNTLRKRESERKVE